MVSSTESQPKPKEFPNDSRFTSIISVFACGKQIDKFYKSMKVFPQPSAALCRSRRHSACQPSYHRVYFVLFILFLPFFLLFFLVVILILQLFHCNFSAVGHILWTRLSRPYGTCSTKQKQMKKKTKLRCNEMAHALLVAASSTGPSSNRPQTAV